MQITFDPTKLREAPEQTSVSHGKSQATTSVNTMKLSTGLDITGKLRDGEVLQEKSTSFQELIQKNGMTGSKEDLNYMMVMSNTMSTEDYAKMMEDGFNPTDTDVETSVTILDQIKLAMVQGGAEVVGFTDTLGAETIEAATGNAGYAADLVQQAEEMAAKLQTPSAATELYMVDHQLQPTIQNLYKAQFASGALAPVQSGYTTAGIGGYMEKTADAASLANLQESMQSIIAESGLPLTDSMLENARFLLENGRAVTRENLELTETLKQLTLPLSKEKLEHQIALAMENGIAPADASLTETETLYEQAVRIRRETVDLNLDGVTALHTSSITLRSLRQEMLLQAQAATEQTGNTKKNTAKAADTATGSTKADEARMADAATSFVGTADEDTEAAPALVTAKRQLAEIQLRMTTETNLALLKRGVQIETAELSDLVEQLKKAEQELSSTQVAQAQAASDEIRSMASLPAAVLGLAASERIAFTVTAVTESGQAMAARYAQAGESYEALQTAPRADLGDSIRTAFRNVDDLLTEMNVEVTQENARATRILGYNHMEITEENLQKVISADRTVRELISEVTPGRALQMIRDGINPLTTDMNELSEYLHSSEAQFSEESEKYSSFLARLEMNNQVTQEEKEAYIGIYRLFRQIEKSDGAAIGYLVNTGAEINFDNLLSAVRSRGRGRMDMKLDESFGGIDATNINASISDQINLITQMSYIREATRAMQSMTEMNEAGAQATDSQGAAETTDAESTRNEATEVVLEQNLVELQRSLEAPDNAVALLQEFDRAVTVKSLVAADTLINSRADLFGGVKESLAKKSRADLSASDEQILADAEETLKQASEEIQTQLTGRAEARQGYEHLADRVLGVLEQLEDLDSVSSLDIKALQATYHQIELGRALSQEEIYEVPIEMNGEWMNINVRMMHGTGTQSAVAMMELEDIGRVAVTFRAATSTQVETLMTAETRGGVQFLTERKEALAGRLSAIGGASSDIPVVRVDRISLDDLRRAAQTDTTINETTSAQLYQCARAFLETIRDNA